MAINGQNAEALMEAERIDKLFEALIFEWGETGGFFFDLRDRKFNQAAFDRTKKILESIDFENQKMIPKSIVGLIWSIPFFMEYNSSNISGADEDTLYNAKMELHRIVENKLENP
jgi:hypothetical protein